jgi:hypothetical protein
MIPFLLFIDTAEAFEKIVFDFLYHFRVKLEGHEMPLELPGHLLPPSKKNKGSPAPSH